jgi:valyl-tRNA synthetase
MIKPPFEQAIDKETHDATIDFFERLMKVLHPFMPFITEEIWHEIRNREENNCIIVSEWPKKGKIKTAYLEEADLIFELITNIRNTRNSKQISPKKELKLGIRTQNQELYKKYKYIISKLANVTEINFIEDKLLNAVSFVIKADEVFIPVSGDIDVEKERQNLLKELEYAKGFLQSVQNKLKNEKFVNSAPEKVIENERKKKEDAEAKIRIIEESLASLKNY